MPPHRAQRHAQYSPFLKNINTSQTSHPQTPQNYNPVSLPQRGSRRNLRENLFEPQVSPKRNFYLDDSPRHGFRAGRNTASSVSRPRVKIFPTTEERLKCTATRVDTSKTLLSSGCKACHTIHYDLGCQTSRKKLLHVLLPV